MIEPGKSIVFATVLVALLLASCIASTGRGTVLRTDDGRTSRVRFFDPPPVRQGDAVQIFRDMCGTVTRGPRSPNCKLHPVGRGIVLEVFDANEVAVEADPGLVLKQGDSVEKLRP